MCGGADCSGLGFLRHVDDSGLLQTTTPRVILARLLSFPKSNDFVDFSEYSLRPVVSRDGLQFPKIPSFYDRQLVCVFGYVLFDRSLVEDAG